jgi:2-haloacid dehalogenase
VSEIRDIEVVVFDILGTLVDEPGGRRAAIRDAVPGAGDAFVDELLDLWERHLDDEQRSMAQGRRAYADSAVLDAEAAQRVADHAGLADPAAVARLATAGRRLPPWDDTVAGLELLTRRFAVLGLSNASTTTLLRLNAHAGLRWHQAVSAEAVRAYKPAPEVYQLAIGIAACPPERMLMVAAHAWDLRAAQAQGMRTAYVDRPVGDPPATSDAFDGRFAGLNDLAAQVKSW